MNKRIQELMIQATVREPYYPAGNDGHPEYRTYVSQEKFAELIVKACADAADMAQDARCKFAGDYVAEQMGFGQEHGVTKWRAE
jgi:hypothetical protein